MKLVFIPQLDHKCLEYTNFIFCMYMNISMKWKNCLGTLGLHYKWVLLFLYLNFSSSLFF